FDLKSFLLSNGLYVTALIRKAHFDAAGGFDTGLTMNEDWDLFISMIKRGGKVYKIPETLFFYRQRENLSSVCNTASKEKKSDNLLKIYNKHYDFYKENGIYFHEMMEMLIKKEKHYNMPLRKWFYKWFKPKRYQALYEQ
ncbi:MAG: glycosyltransferase family 2 protein, partial [Neisseria sp.]|nr:glycosyltransferase family 2 protein [Neisseria sp.]